MRPAAILAWVAGLGFGLPAAYGAWYLGRHDEVWTFLGFPTYGGGPFEDAGIESSPALLGAFAGLCALEVVAGVLLWRRRRPGVVLAFALLPLELVFWIGFALPFGPVLGVGRCAALIAARREVAAVDGSLGRG